MLNFSNELESADLPLGPFAHLPGFHGSQSSYDLYCTRSGELCQSFPYCESAHLAEMDSFMLGVALNVRYHGGDLSDVLDDCRRASLYEDFRLYFPGRFVTRNTSLGKVDGFAVCCHKTENIFCRVTGHGFGSTACLRAERFCESLNDLIRKLDSALACTVGALADNCPTAFAS